MFLLSTIKDIVRIEPSQLISPRSEALSDAINAKYSNKVLHNAGLVIRVTDILSVSDPVVFACQDGNIVSKGTLTQALLFLIEV